MKRIFAKILLCALGAILCFGFAACGGDPGNNPGPTEPAVTYTENAETPTVNRLLYTEYDTFIRYRNPLLHTYDKLARKEKINVVFYGGSVTQGYGASDPERFSWRGRTGTFLRETYPEQVNLTDSACGASGTYLGAFRNGRDVLAHAPDLLFLEFSINDYYMQRISASAANEERIAMQLETILREVRDSYPNCDIVALFVTEASLVKDAKAGKLHEEAQVHEEICARYNVSTLHVGRALASLVDDNWVNRPSDDDKTNEGSWYYYMHGNTDVVHPNDEGYGVYFNVVKEFLRNVLDSVNCAPSVPHNYLLPEMRSEHLFDGAKTEICGTGTTVDCEAEDASCTLENLLSRSVAAGGSGFTYVDRIFTVDGLKNYTGYLALDRSATDRGEFGIEFEGTELALLTNLNKSAASFLLDVDGSGYVKKPFANNKPLIVVQDLPSGKHTVKIRIDFTDGSVPESALTAIGGVVKIGAVFTRDAQMQSVAV